MGKNLDSKISSTMRELWMKSEPRKLALIRSRVPCNDGSRKKFLETCEVCKRTAYIGEKEFVPKKDGTLGKRQRKVLIVHHLDEVPNVWADDFMRRLFCHEDRLQVLCACCHEKAHNDLRNKT